MRAFVAVMLPDVVRAELAPRVAHLRALEPTMTWEASERWHITLTFLGIVEESVIDTLDPRLRRAASRTESFTLSLGSFGQMGQRVLHASVAGDHASLRRLAERTSAAARRVGLDVADRKYRPHVTLARSRHGADLRALTGAAAAPEVQWAVTDIALVSSILGSERRYDIVATYPLDRGVEGDA